MSFALFAARSLAETLAAAGALWRIGRFRCDPNRCGRSCSAGMDLINSRRPSIGTRSGRARVSTQSKLRGCISAEGVSLVFSGRHQDGYETLVTHLRLNPRDPGNWRAFHLIAIARYLLGDYPGAVEACRHTMREKPNQRLSFRWLVASLAQGGRVAEAREAEREAAATLPHRWLEEHWLSRQSWLREEDHKRLLEGLRKARWQG